MSFELTDTGALVNEYSIYISAGAAGISILLSAAFLIASAWVYTCKEARPCLDRVSFRIVLWSMGFEILYCIFYLPLDVDLDLNGPSCVASAYFTIATLGTVNYLCTCIALNLMVTITFGLNPIALRLERYWVGGSIFLGFVIPLVPAGLGHFGADPVLGGCWFVEDDHDTRLVDLVMDLYLWQIISCVLASVAVIMTMITLLKQSRATSDAMASLDFLDEEEGETAPETWRRKIRRCFGLSRTPKRFASEHSLGRIQDQFLKIALKISLYPIALVIINVTITFGDLYITNYGETDSNFIYGLFVIYFVFYGTRGIAFGLLGFFVDPCLRRGIKVAWQHRRKSVQISAEKIDGDDDDQRSGKEHVGLEAMFDSDPPNSNFLEYSMAKREPTQPLTPVPLDTSIFSTILEIGPKPSQTEISSHRSTSPTGGLRNTGSSSDGPLGEKDELERRGRPERGNSAPDAEIAWTDGSRLEAGLSPPPRRARIRSDTEMRERRDIARRYQELGMML